jgi:large conductance mechanosensitive channel
MSILKEFRAFALRGNVVDLAVGIIIGAAFGKIVSSLVDKVLMPPLGLLIGDLNFSQLAITLRAASEGKDAVVIGYGAFIQDSISFVIVAWACFMLVRGMNKLLEKAKKDEAAHPAPAPAPSPSENLLAEIRDLLKAQK